MFIPFHDANSLKHIRLQYVTIGLIVANVVIWLYTTLGSAVTTQAAVISFGYIPYFAMSPAALPEPYLVVPDSFSYITYAFLHGDIFHLGGNMLFLWVFGDNVEDALGHFRYLVFYLVCAAAGAWLHGIMDPASQTPLIGASGAIAGVVAAYLLLHPRVKVWVLVLMRLPLRIPAWIPIVLWILFQFFMLAAAGEEEVSWAAHVGGIVAGAILVLVLRRKGVPLFDREIVTPRGAAVVVPAAAPAPAQEPQAPTMPWGRQ